MHLKVVLCSSLLLLFIIPSVAQNQIQYKAQAIDVSLISLNPKIKNVGFDELMNASRFGQLLTTPTDTFRNNGSLSVSGFVIGISVKPLDSLLKHAFEVTFSSETIEAQWGEWTGDSATTSITGRYENFLLGLGYEYFLKRGKFLQLQTGIHTHISFPVSAITTETVQSNDESSSVDLFGHKKVGFRSSIPFVASFKIFKPVRFTFGIVPTINVYQLDGLKKTKFWVANEVGLRFYLK